MKKDKIKNPSTDSLQQKLLSTRYSIIDQMISVKDSLQKEQMLVKSKASKIQQLHKKILQLENAQKNNNKRANQYYQKLRKLQTSQNIAINLLSLKATNFRQRQQDQYRRRQMCMSFRQGLQESKRKSVDIFEKRKARRVQKIKQQQLQYYFQRTKRSQSDLQRRKKLSSQVRESQILSKQRLKRYEQFKLAQAKFNYDSKKQQLLKSHTQKITELRNLKHKVDEEEELFRKTQRLNDQVTHIQSLYITGT